MTNQITSIDQIPENIWTYLSYYTSPKSSSYDPNFDKKIREERPDWFVNTADINKEKLLKMAKDGEERPSNSSKDPEIKKLGSSLSRYTNPKNGCYDPDFTNQIQKLNPDWFKNFANINKEKLLRMAKNGEEKPSCSSKDTEIKKLGSALLNYISPKSGCYDPDFTKQIQKLNPDWFKNTATIKKEQLLQMAKNGERKPSSESKDPEIKKLGSALPRYTNQKSETYDSSFDREIRKLRPDWFKTTDIKKEQLLQMAKNGEERPSGKNKDSEIKKLGSALSCYTNPKNSSYDPSFNHKIRKLRPDWFENTANIKKGQLLQMAKDGKEKPSSESKDPKIKKLGKCLLCYTNPKRNTYDSSFNQKIRSLRPDWFIRSNKLRK